VDLLEQIVPGGEERTASVDLSGLIAEVRAYAAPDSRVQCCGASQLEEDLLLRALEAGALDHHGPISTADRSVGARLSGAIADGSFAPRGPVRLQFEGTAGQGFGFALIDPIELRLIGYANDTV